MSCLSPIYHLLGVAKMADGTEVFLIKLTIVVGKKINYNVIDTLPPRHEVFRICKTLFLKYIINKGIISRTTEVTTGKLLVIITEICR